MTKFLSDYETLLNELLAIAAAHCQPVNGVFELTERCNLKCEMCYIGKPRKDYISQKKELQASDWVRLAQMASNNGMLFLLITGGEIFVRDDFFQIYQPITKLGLVIVLFTNGTLISDTTAQKLSENPPNRIEITLYGGTKKTYEAITGVKNSYDHCCKGIELLLSEGLPVVLKSTITRNNVQDLEKMRNMAASWGVPFSASWLLTRRRDGSLDNIESLRLPPNECVDLENKRYAREQEWIENALRQSPEGDNRNFFCHAGRSSFVINATGEMIPCIDIQSPSIRPLDIDFSAAWEVTQDYVRKAPPSFR